MKNSTKGVMRENNAQQSVTDSEERERKRPEGMEGNKRRCMLKRILRSRRTWPPTRQYSSKLLP